MARFYAVRFRSVSRKQVLKLPSPLELRIASRAAIRRQSRFCAGSVAIHDAQFRVRAVLVILRGRSVADSLSRAELPALRYSGRP